jgi:hypothetical protein
MADEIVETEAPEAAPTETGPERQPDVDPARKALVSSWIDKIKRSKLKFDPDFKRMRECMQLARDGATKEWVLAKKYTVPILNRHINTQVAQLYAKHPQPVVQRRKKLLFQLWDGTSESAMAAFQAAQTGDPNAAAVLNEVAMAQIEMKKLDNMAKTLEIVDTYYMNEQKLNYKAQLKKMVRRTKVCGVGYLLLDFQRMLGEDSTPNPDKEARISDVRTKIEEIERIMAAGAHGDLKEDSAEVERLRLLLVDIERPETVVVREGPVLSFPKSTQVIVDENCYHLKSFAGAGYVAVEYDKTPSEIRSEFKTELNQYRADEEGKKRKNECVKIWKVWDRVAEQVFVVCDGHADFLQEPADPEIRLDRFLPIFALVFNETEEDETDGGSIYPPSDVWQARHPQDEYNRSREGLREHRRAARPYWVATKGLLEGQDKAKFGNHDAHELFEINVTAMDAPDVSKIIQRGPTAPIDPNLYEVEMVFADMQRVVGTQEANLGGVSGATATETSIAEASRSSSIEDNIDDLDEFLSEVAHAKGQMYFQTLSVDTVREIVGQGAVWPEQPMTREQIAKDLMLDIKAGSSGRPNKAAKLANMERAMPFLIQFPNLNSEPVLKEYLSLLDIDADEAMAKGLPSVVSINSMMQSMGGQPQPGTGDPATDPNQQGGQGAQNQPQPDQTEPGPQPAYPAA